MSPSTSFPRLSRRNFLKTTAAAAAAPMIVPARVLFGPQAPSAQMTFGCIGVGRQGRGDMQELIYRGLEAGARVVAVCDVNAHRRDDAQWLAEKIYAAELGRAAYKGVDAYDDFRELLARRDIDGVLIVSPDHWHGFQAAAAAEAGKDIYLEKPMTYTIPEGRRLVEAVRRNTRILQVGSQQRSSERSGPSGSSSPSTRGKAIPHPCRCRDTSTMIIGWDRPRRPPSPRTASIPCRATNGRAGCRSSATATA
jgi:hypothetical protein